MFVVKLFDEGFFRFARTGNNLTTLIFLFDCLDTEGYLKSGSHLPKIFIIICFNDSPSKMMKNAFYFILKVLFVLKIFKFLS